MASAAPIIDCDVFALAFFPSLLAPAAVFVRKSVQAKFYCFELSDCTYIGLTVFDSQGLCFGNFLVEGARRADFAEIGIGSVSFALMCRLLKSGKHELDILHTVHVVEGTRRLFAQSAYILMMSILSKVLIAGFLVQ